MMMAFFPVRPIGRAGWAVIRRKKQDLRKEEEN